jgi:hypothetical protein
MALAVALSGCSRPIDVRNEVTINGAYLAEGMKLEIFVDGIATPFLQAGGDSGGPKLTFKTQGILKGKSLRMPELKMKVLFGCGWREFPIRLDQHWNIDQVRAQAEKGEAITYTAHMPDFPGSLGSLWVDTRGSSGGELGLGPLKIPVPAGTPTRLSVDTCDAPIPVTFDGTPVGEIPAASPGAYSQPTVMIDPSGRHCYQQYDVWYAPENVGGGGKSKPVALSGRKLYFSPEFIAYVLEEPPSMTMAPNGTYPQYRALVDAECP